MKKLFLLFNLILIANFNFSQIAPEELIDIVVDIDAEYPGGTTECYKFISENINYPKSAINENLEGKCYIGFIIDKYGNVSEVKAIKGIDKCPECNEEAIRVIQSMPKWTPGMKDGKYVNSRYVIPINFKLEKTSLFNRLFGK